MKRRRHSSRGVPWTRLRRRTSGLLWGLPTVPSARGWARVGPEMRARIARHSVFTAVSAVVLSNALIGLETFLLVQLSFNGGQLTFAETLGAPNFPAVVGAIVTGIVVNVVFGLLVFRPQLEWFVSCRPADHARRRAVQRVPGMQLLVSVAAWVSAALFYVAVADDLTLATVAGVAVAFTLAGASSACLTYLFVERASRPLSIVVLEDFPATHVMHGVRIRLMVVWVVCSAIPMIGLLTVNAGRFTGLLPDVAGAVDWTTVVLTLVALAAGARVIALVGQALADPLTEMHLAVHRVEHGDYNARVPVYDSSELGVLQHGFNEMVKGLAERERMREIFARHVGDTVADLAISDGIGMHGTNTRVGVLFVDIVGSTKLSQDRSPDDVAELLNAFFSIVFDVVDHNQGFVNKFEGDAALAIFGAPVEIEDPAGHALAAARELADRLANSLDIRWGIGVSYGEVFAGNIGHERRYEYTVIGDPVNECSRLSDMAKTGRVPALAGGAAIEAAGTEAQEWELLGSRIMRGRSVPTEFYAPRELVNRLGSSTNVIAELLRPARKIVGANLKTGLFGG
ncbi:adenylate/guanylate cyclase domain-containing protein [Gordonia paraffinivorans]|uniref:adenylate/guanylate cyclase domain-containing protein n=1 Tax=Gordonia paraffinivorans TaxID=175628 RepID=UPI000D61E3ED|nr:adenylate/guanylate cyclase domain-containing protein [Gordonia paraffinivorans]PWD43200.1 adenylate/guanylate cyclase domain-containing protein [Gordonia paraffinivorans]